MHQEQQDGQVVIVQLREPPVWRGTHPAEVPLSKKIPFYMCYISPWPLTSDINTLLLTFMHMHSNTELLQPKEENKGVNMEC